MEAVEPASNWNPARQCTATNREGVRCRRQPIPGGTVCVNHGGSIPEVQRVAKLRLLAMVEPILNAFEEILAQYRGSRCLVCNRGDAAPVIRIGQLVLDRAGFHPTLTVEHVEPPNAFKDLSEDELIERTEAMLAQMKDTRDMHRQHALPTSFTDADAFEVPEDDRDLLWSIRHVEGTIAEDAPEIAKEDAGLPDVEGEAHEAELNATLVPAPEPSDG